MGKSAKAQLNGSSLHDLGWASRVLVSRVERRGHEIGPFSESWITKAKDHTLERMRANIDIRDQHD